MQAISNLTKSGTFNRSFLVLKGELKKMPDGRI
jgi:hypothetical protein